MCGSGEYRAREVWEGEEGLRGLGDEGRERVIKEGKSKVKGSLRTRSTLRNTYWIGCPGDTVGWDGGVLSGIGIIVVGQFFIPEVVGHSIRHEVIIDFVLG